MGDKLLEQSKESRYKYSPAAVTLLRNLDDGLINLEQFENWFRQKPIGDGDILNYLNQGG